MRQMVKEMGRASVKLHVKALLKRTAAPQKEAYLVLLSQSFGPAFAERVARYADSHPVLR